MSKIDELIERLCPDGVEYKKLSCLASYARERIAASDLEPGSYVGVNELLQEYRGRSYEVHVPSEEKCISYRPGAVSYTHLDVYKRQRMGKLLRVLRSRGCGSEGPRIRLAGWAP